MVCVVAHRATRDLTLTRRQRVYCDHHRRERGADEDRAGGTAGGRQHAHHQVLPPARVASRAGSGYQRIPKLRTRRRGRSPEDSSAHRTGIALDEVRDVLAEDRAADLDDVLTELDADLARRAEAIQRQRQRIADLRDTLSAGVPRDEVADIADRLAEIYSGAETTVEIEHSLLEVFTELDPQVTSLYRSALADENMAARSAELATRFEALATADPADDEVECLARDIVACSGELGEMARGELERIDFGGRFGTDDLLDALTGSDELSAAQRRCVQRMVALGRQAWS